MLEILKKKLRSNAIAAICPDQDGIAVARVCREIDLPPVLEMCVYHDRVESQSEENTLKDISDEDDLERLACVSTMELGSYSLLMVEAPDVQPDELRAAIRWKIKDLIDFPIDESVVDVFEVPNAKAAAGRNNMMYVVVARTDSVKEKIDNLLDAKINLTAIDIPEMALKNIASLLPEDVGGVVMVYLGQNMGLITITRHSTLYLSRRIEKGLNSLPDSIMHDNELETTKAWLDDIIVEVQRSLDYYESHFTDSQVSSIVITPLPRQLDGIAEYFTEQMDLPARVMDISSLIDVQEQTDQITQANCILAIGAALRKEGAAL